MAARPSPCLPLVLALLVGCGPPGPETDGGTGGGAAAGGGAGGGGGASGGAGGSGGTGGTGGTGGAGGTGGGSSVRRIISLSVTPAALTLRVGNVAGVTALATFDDATQADVSGTVTWTVTPSAVASATVTSAADNLVAVSALAPGTAQLTASTGSLTSNAVTVTVGAAPADGGTPPGAEVRAVWATRFAYNTQADVESIIDKAAAAGFNVIYFQIRGNGDAYYQSALAPWAKKLTGTLGQSPGWDPLQVAINRARLRGIQLHAYWNVFSAWPTPAGCASTGSCTCQPAQGQSDSCALPEASPAGKPTHFLRANPQTLAVNSAGKSTDTEYYWFSPGDPLVRQHLLEVARELLTNYDVDGLHLDRVRYPGQSTSWDAASNAAYAALSSPKPTREEWQRGNVTAMVRALYDAVKQLRPKAVLSASVWGIYKPLSGCSTSQGYANYYQDSIGWMKTGAIDAIDPMIYWDIGTGCTDWTKHLDIFMAGANGRHVIAGMHALDQSVPKPDRIAARIAYARQVGAAGTTIFASTYLNQAPATGGQPDTWSTFRAPGGPFVVDAGTPPITWR